MSNGIGFNWDPEYYETMNFIPPQGYNGLQMQIPQYTSSGFISGLGGGGGSGGGGNPLASIGGGLMTAGGIIGSIINRPKAQTIDYNRPAELDSALADLMALPSMQEALSTMTRSTNATVGQTRREGARDIQGSLASPETVAKFIRDLNVDTAGVATQAGAQNFNTAFNTTLGKASTLGSLSLQEQDLKDRLAIWNAQQKQMEKDYWGNLFGGVAGLGAQVAFGGL